MGEIGNPRLIIEWWDTSSANSTDLEPAHMRSLFCNVQFVLAKARVQLNCYCYTFHVIKKEKWKIFARTALDWTSYTFTQCRTQGGGQKGHIPPPPHEVTTRHTLPPEKKLIIDLMTPKASCKNGNSVSCSNQIPTRLQSVKMVGH